MRAGLRRRPVVTAGDGRRQDGHCQSAARDHNAMCSLVLTRNDNYHSDHVNTIDRSYVPLTLVTAR